jgi:hypothetical protein
MTVVAFAVALAIQTRRYQIAAQEAENRTLECEYYVQEMLEQDKELDEWRILYGSSVPPKSKTQRGQQ